MLDLLPSRHGAVLVCGHRGHIVDGHENTRPALDLAAAHGASMCEIDLRMTADRRLVVFHDDILDDASTGTGLISHLTYAEVARSRTRSRHGLPIEGQPIALFEDILAHCRTLGLGMIVEVKDRFADTAYLEQVAASIRAADMAGAVLISSFDYVTLREMKAIAPEMRSMGINYHRLADPAGAARSAAMDVMNTDYPQFAPDIARALHEADVAVSHYLPRPDHFARRRAYGDDYHARLATILQDGLVDMIVCDDVAWATGFVRDCGLTVARAGLATGAAHV